MKGNEIWMQEAMESKAYESRIVIQLGAAKITWKVLLRYSLALRVTGDSLHYIEASTRCAVRGGPPNFPVYSHHLIKYEVLSRGLRSPRSILLEQVKVDLKTSLHCIHFPANCVE